MTSVLAPAGVKGSDDLVMQVFTSATQNLQNKIDQQIFSEESQTALKQLYNEVSGLSSKSKALTQTVLDMDTYIEMIQLAIPKQTGIKLGNLGQKELSHIYD
jgi:hypothetical protein